MRTRRSKLLLTFGLSFLVLGVFWLVIGGVQSFDLFNLWTVTQNIKAWGTYVKASSVDDAAMGTVLAQLGFGNGEYRTDASLTNLFRILEVSEALVETDVVALMLGAEDRQGVLNAHIHAVQAVRYETVDVAAGYQAQANSYLDTSNICLATKQAGDRDFFEWVNQADGGLATIGYEQSLGAAPCYITNRVKANAMTYLSTRVQAYAGLLSQREQILNANQHNIVTYPELLQGDLLEQLLSTKYQLAQLKSVPYGNVQSTFGGFTTAGTSFLPNYFDVFFPGKRPTYLNPQLELTTQ